MDNDSDNVTSSNINTDNVVTTAPISLLDLASTFQVGATFSTPQLTTPQPIASTAGASGISSAQIIPQTYMPHMYTHLKLPSFWPDKAELYFHVVDSTFRRHNITSQKIKFDELLHVLNSEQISNISLELMNLNNDPYDQIKASLLDRYQISDKERLNKLFEIKLGNTKPTEMLRKMILMSRIKENDSKFATGLIREMFLRQLPESQGVL